MTESTRTRTVHEICRRLRPILGPRMDDIWLAYTIEDSSGRKEIEELIQILAASVLRQDLQKDGILLVPPTQSRAEGEYFIGDVYYSDKLLYPFGLREDEWIQHVGIFGRSGAGKTNIGFSIVSELVKKNKPFLIFDWKRNYRDLIKLSGFENLQIFTIGRRISPLRFNPLIPPHGTDPRTWLKKLIEVIAHAYFLGNGVMFLLQQAIDAVYKEYRVYTEESPTYPTLRDVLKWLREYPARGREANWHSSALRAVSTLCFGEMDNIINTDENRALEKILEEQVVLELDALTQSDKIFFIEALLLWIHHYRLGQRKREEFMHAIIIEEAHHILSKSRYSLIGAESIMETTFREIREFGESIVILDQHPSQISLPALGNTYCTITMNLKHRKDVNIAANCMLLSDEEKKWLGSLDVGYAIVKLQGRIPNPFLIKIPEFHIKKGSVTDRDIIERIKFLENRPRTIESELSVSVELEQEKPLTLLERRFLLDVSLYRNSGTVERYRRLGLSARRGNQTKNILLAGGFIEQEEVINAKGKAVLVRLTEKGKEYLRAHQAEKSVWSLHVETDLVYTILSFVLLLTEFLLYFTLFTICYYIVYRKIFKERYIR